MKAKRAPVHLSTIRRKYKDKVYECHLLRRTVREGKTVRNETVANLSHLPADVIELIRLALSGRKLVPVEDAMQVERSLPTGHVAAVLCMMRKLGIAELLSTRPCRERDLVLGMIAERVLHPTSKLGTLRLWGTTTLAADVGVEDAATDELYGAMDWLLSRQARVEEKLSKRHLAEGGIALYDLSNSHYEGRTCPLAQIGHDKDGRRGATVIAYGLLADKAGRPVAMEVYPGNTEDSSTLMDQVLKTRVRFGLSRVVLVGDRGTLTNARVTELQQGQGLGWIAALRHASIRQLMDGGVLQPSLFDTQDLAEIESPEYPGERLVACHNPFMAQEQARKRESLLKATEERLERIRAEVARLTTPMSAAEIGLKVGRVLYRQKMAKHLDVRIDDGVLEFCRDEESIRREADLDGIYVLRTSEPVERLSAEDTVRGYKSLTEVEAAFRCLKGVDLRVHPVFHRDEGRVRAHFFLCMLAYYVEWHMRRALAPLLYVDQELPADKPVRDPVKRASPSASARAKKGRKQTPDGFPVHSFQTLLSTLATQARLTCRVGGAAATFDQVTPPTPLQQRAFELLGL